MPASSSGSTSGSGVPVSALLNGSSDAAAIAAPSPIPTITTSPASQRAIRASCRGVAPTSRSRASSRPRERAIIASVFTAAIAVKTKISPASTRLSQTTIRCLAASALRSAARPATLTPEALANVAKYAHATAVTLQVARNGSSVRVEVADNGVGGADPAHGSGLRGLEDRVEALGGALRVASPPGSGTTVTAELPCAS